MSRLQKIALVAGFMLLVFGIGFLLYIVFFKPLVPGSNNANLQNTSTGLPGSNENQNGKILPGTNGTLPLSGDINANANTNAQIQQSGQGQPLGPTASVTSLSNARTYNATLSENGLYLYYYDRESGKFYKTDSKGNTTPLDNKIFYQVERVSWSTNREKAILEYPDGANIVYNFSSKKQYTLPKHWTDFNFSPDSDKIISKSIGINNENNFLIISDSTGTKTKVIRELGENAEDVLPLWSPNNQVVGVYVRGSDLEQQEIFFIGQNSENFKSMLVEGWGFKGQWTPQGDKLLYSVYSSRTQNKPELWIVDAQSNSIGRNRRELKVETWADKCAFYDNDTLYCAVPEGLQDNAGLFPDEMDTAPDMIYKINISTGSKTLVAQPDQNHTMDSIFVSPNGDSIYFTDKNDGKIYKVGIK